MKVPSGAFLLSV
ncbi:hypothetical protein N6N95_23050 [Escherichia coli]|nr:hypothetical protein [Escherichia coli]MDC7082884.1 hypothetical protein [Escherichia coli]